jgi:hypothetical protein
MLQISNRNPKYFKYIFLKHPIIVLRKILIRRFPLRTIRITDDDKKHLKYLLNNTGIGCESDASN